jgi:hypothetical protein
MKVVENGRLEGTRAATKAFSFHPIGEGCRQWKVGRDPAGQPLKLSPFIPVVTVVEIGRLEGTQGAATKVLLSSQW